MAKISFRRGMRVRVRARVVDVVLHVAVWWSVVKTSRRK